MDNNYQVYNWGPLLLKYDNIPQDIIDAFIEEGDRLTIEHNDHSDYLAGVIEEEKGYSNEFTWEMCHKLEPYFNNYLEELCQRWKQIDKIFYWEPISFWINYQRKGEFNPSHTHNGDLSFVLYVDIPEEINREEVKKNGNTPGAIYFNWGSNKTTVDSEFVIQCVEGITHQIHRPVTGELFIFPATLEHSAMSFESDVIRKSVSGNIRIMRDK